MVSHTQIKVRSVYLQSAEFVWHLEKGSFKCSWKKFARVSSNNNISVLANKTLPTAFPFGWTNPSIGVVLVADKVWLSKDVWLYAKWVSELPVEFQQSFPLSYCFKYNVGANYVECFIASSEHRYIRSAQSISIQLTTSVTSIIVTYYSTILLSICNASEMYGSKQFFRHNFETDFSMSCLLSILDSIFLQNWLPCGRTGYTRTVRYREVNDSQLTKNLMVLWNPKCYYRAHIKLLIGSSPESVKPNTSIFCFLKINFNIILLTPKPFQF
jgi:hypothetical protein